MKRKDWHYATNAASLDEASLPFGPIDGEEIRPAWRRKPPIVQHALSAREINGNIHVAGLFLRELVREDPLANQMERFGAVVRGEVRPIVSARDGLENLRITEAIFEAARTGRIVETANAAAA